MLNLKPTVDLMEAEIAKLPNGVESAKYYSDMFFTSLFPVPVYEHDPRPEELFPVTSWNKYRHMYHSDLELISGQKKRNLNRRHIATGTCTCSGEQHRISLYYNGNIKFESHKDIKSTYLIAAISYNLFNKPFEEQMRLIPENMGCLKFFMCTTHVKESNGYWPYTYNMTNDWSTFRPHQRDSWLFNTLQLCRYRSFDALSTSYDITGPFSQAYVVREVYKKKVLKPFFETKEARQLGSRMMKALHNHRMDANIYLNVIPNLDFYGAISTPPPRHAKRETAFWHNEGLRIYIGPRWYTTVYKKGLPSIVDGNFILSSLTQVNRTTYLVICSRTASNTYRMDTVFGLLSKKANGWSLEHVGVTYQGRTIDNSIMGISSKL